MPAEEKPVKERFDPAATDAISENARAGARKRRDPNEPTAVVGLGASAGGVAVLQQFFSDMKPDSGLAFVVVMHLSPGHESNLASILQQKTAMPVMQLSEPVKVKPNHVYVIPPNHQLTFAEGLLQLVEPQQALGRRVTIDLFFRTLAQAYGQRGVCVVLSGTDSDGAIGVKHIRAQGGVTIAQDPNEAEHDSMPLTAISTGMIDWVLPIAEMPAKLLEFVQNEHRMKLPPEIPEAKEPDAKVEDAPGGETVSDETRAPEHEAALGEVLAHLRAHTGHDFAHYKRATVLRRIARRLQVNSLETIPHYLEFLRKHPAEVRALLQDLLIGVTHFFRDQESFATLETNIPQLFAGKQKNEQFRVWVAGSATGEEAYSIAMLLCEHAERLESPPTIQIFASDIDEQAIVEARDGLYPATIEADVSQERLRRFFAKDHGRYRVRKSLREKILFAPHNLLSDAPFSRLDLVSCRNLLIYLTSKAQEQVFDIFHFALRSGGLLFIGGSESSTVQGLFSPVDPKHRIYVRRSVPRPTWKVPMRTRALPALGQKAVENSAKKSDESLFLGQERRAALFGELHLKLLEQYAPPSLVVNEEHEVVHLSEKAGRYLRLSPGEPSANLFRLINPALQIELRTALFRASQGDELTVTSAPQTVHFDGRSESISLQVRRVASTPAEKFYLVLFQKEPDLPLSRAQPAAHGDVTRGLDEEINYLKEQLSSTVEQYEAGNEESKASNEELQAINEELRSATEELETSQEELHSVNEELSTVNNELKNSVEDLSRANTDLNNLMSSTDIGTIFLNRQLRIHRFTPSAQKIFNLLPADLGRPLADITHKLDYKNFLTDAEEVLDRRSTIEREVCQDGGEIPQDEVRWYLSRIAPYRTVEDRIAGVVATFIDITQRKRAEDNVRASHRRAESQAQKFSTIMAGAPDFLYEFNLAGRFTYISQSLLNLWQKTPEQAIGKNFHELEYPPELATKLQRQIEEVIETQKTMKDETPFTSAFGARIYEYILFPLRTSDGHVEGVGGVTRDVTERRQAEEQLRASEEQARQSEQRYRTVFNSMDEAYYVLEMIFDPGDRPVDFRILETNLAFEKLTGLKNAAGKRVRELLPEIEENWIETYGRVAITGQSARVDGSVGGLDGRWYYGYAFRVGGDDSRQVAVVFSEITERKRREANLAFLADIGEELSRLSTPDEVMDRVGAKIGEYLKLGSCDFVEIDEAAEQELTVTHVWAKPGVMSPLGKHRIKDFLTEEFVRSSHAGELTIVANTQSDPRTDGRALAAQQIAAFIIVPFIRGAEWKYMFSITDTVPREWREDEIELVRELAQRIFPRLERARAEEALRESEARLRAMFEQASVGIVQVGAGGRFVAANRGFCHFVGYNESELKQMLVRDVTDPADYAEEEKLTRRLTSGEISEYTLDKRYVCKEGEVVWATMTATFVRRASGEPLYTLAIIQPIGDRKRAEEELRLSEERFRQFAENSADVFWIVDAAKHELEYLNPVFEEMWGAPRETLMKNIDRFDDIVHPEDREAAGQAMRSALAGERAVVEYRIIRPSDGSVRWMRDTGFPIRDEGGIISRVAGVVQDVTADKARSEDLRRSEERFRLLVEGARDYAMFLLSLENEIIYWNAGAERVFGWTAEEAIGQRGEIVFTPEDRAIEREETEIAIALADGSADDRRWHLRKDGSRVWVDGVMHRLDDENGNPHGFAKVARDVTKDREHAEELARAHQQLEARVVERTAQLTTLNKRLQSEIRHRSELEGEVLLVSEREKRRIGQDLHDSLCQELAAACFFLQSSANKIEKKNPREAEVLAQAATIVNANVGLARDLARGLYPIELSAAGLTAALRELAFRFSHGGVNCKFESPKPIGVKDEAVALNLYRIAQEAVTNAVKNGKANKVIIHLARRRQRLVLKVTDNGQGFAAKKASKGMGVHIMKYRANVIGGSLTVESEEGHGAAVTCTVTTA
ncbi:MAG: PAS domain S-box protein [Chthoniobacterales bacterium]|nr:PAS domain S-box protein [Chthoniobacterales bacterium]